MRRKTIILLVALFIYLVLRHIVPFGGLVLYPIRLFVTFLHEIGHAFFAVITGGSVTGIQINLNGSGYALITGGWMPLVLAGGYLGSALFGNLILFIALTKERMNVHMSSIFICLILLTGIFLYQSVETSILLFGMATLLFIAVKILPEYLSTVNAFLGAASICYILEDFASGPASDIAKFTQYIPFIPSFAWAIVWLLIALYMTYYNVRYFILKR